MTAFLQRVSHVNSPASFDSVKTTEPHWITNAALYDLSHPRGYGPGLGLGWDLYVTVG